MANKLFSDTIYVDTSIFESQNYYEGNNIKTLFELGNAGHIKIVIPVVTYGEVIARMKRKLHQLKKYYDQNKKEIEPLLRILRIIDSHKSKFPFPGIRFKEDEVALENGLDKMLQHGKAILIDEDVPFQPIFEKYFKGDPPFQKDKESKKHEFPDAFALAVVERWCEKNNKQVYALSLDKDILEYKSPYLTPAGDLPTLIDRVNRHIEAKKVAENIKIIDKLFIKEIPSFLGDLEKEIEDWVKESLSALESATFEFEREPVLSIQDLEVTGHSIIFVGQGEANVDVRVSFILNLDIEAIDYSEAIYDPEDNQWLGEKPIEIGETDTVTASVQITVIYGKEAKGAWFTISSINDGMPLDVDRYI
jgi:hypothetical protein